MKLFKFLSHPYTLITCFLIIMISGEHLVGFYVVYILLGLPFGAIHSLQALAGILVLLLTYRRFKIKNSIAQLLNTISVAMLFGSIYLFFTRDTKHYNYVSFEQTVPIITMILAAFIAV